ncbi:unnamed protein product [Heligmosomoides polygyrus]|uniref:Uncharacterized protein n=1 Tax=Heligmosomoides polygyrus TaxID=6339 RepID=A0A183GQN2_HELPZ|nr:unnamed protein product [Heligmosomoides polygyrus]
MSELAKLCRGTMKKDLNERRAEVLTEAAKARLSVRNARRNIASFETIPISSIATSTCPHAIFRAMDAFYPPFSLPRYNSPSRR